MNRNEERHKKEKAHWAAKEEDTYTSEERYCPFLLLYHVTIVVC